MILEFRYCVIIFWRFVNEGNSVIVFFYFWENILSINYIIIELVCLVIKKKKNVINVDNYLLECSG